MQKYHHGLYTWWCIPVQVLDQKVDRTAPTDIDVITKSCHADVRVWYHSKCESCSRCCRRCMVAVTVAVKCQSWPFHYQKILDIRGTSYLQLISLCTLHAPKFAFWSDSSVIILLGNEYRTFMPRRLIQYWHGSSLGQDTILVRESEAVITWRIQSILTTRLST